MKDILALALVRAERCQIFATTKRHVSVKAKAPGTRRNSNPILRTIRRMSRGLRAIGDRPRSAVASLSPN